MKSKNETFQPGDMLMCNGAPVKYVRTCTPDGRKHLVSDGSFTLKVSSCTLSRPLNERRATASTLVSRPPKRRNQWTRGYICAVATLLKNQGDDGVAVAGLLKCAGPVEHILRHADEEDIVVLRAAGFLLPNAQSEPRR